MSRTVDWKDVEELTRKIREQSDRIMKLVYVLPAGVPEEMGIAVAKGQATVEQVAKLLDELRSRNHEEKEGDREEMWKEKYAELVKHHEELEIKYKDNIVAFEEASKIAMKKNEELHQENMKLLIEVKGAQEKAQQFQALETALKQLTGQPVSQSATTNNHTRLKGLTIQGEEITVKVQKPIEKTLEFRTETNQGKIMFIIIVEKKGAPTSEKEVIEAATEHGWVLNHNNTAPELGKLANQGILVREQGNPIRFRPPAKLRFQVT